ncbi:MAG: glycosyltransferase [bacterium]
MERCLMVTPTHPILIMNILMMTNTFTPFVGGVERSVELFTNEYRKLGHRVIIIAPSFENMPENEVDVIRVPAIQHFNGTDFSLALPIHRELSDFLKNFKADIIHSHHPFIIGDTAFRIASANKIPLIFTFHTFYEKYTHYVPGDSLALKRFVIALSTGYANLCDYVFAPSESVAYILRKRGIETPIEVIPTGIDVEQFCKGDGNNVRKLLNIPSNAFVVGFVSRIATEKNLGFMSKAVVSFMEKEPLSHFLIVGRGPQENELKDFFRQSRLDKRVHWAGSLDGQKLVDGYHAIDVFIFASQTETQGIVLAEAMGAGKPVIALDGYGIWEVVRDGYNGRLLVSEDINKFSAALQWIATLPREKRELLEKNARKTADRFSIKNSVEHALQIYERMIKKGYSYQSTEENVWASSMRFIKAEWDIIVNLTKATGEAIKSEK